MPIGSSEGEYYEDNNVRMVAQNQPRLYVSPRRPPEATEKPADAIELTRPTETPGKGSQQEIPDFTTERPHDIIERAADKLFGITGERYHTWPERLLDEASQATAQVARGEISMWAMDPTTGQFHTSPEGIEAADKITSLAMGGPRSMRPIIHLRGEGYDALNEGHDDFQEFLSGRGSRQTSNIHEGMEHDYENYTPSEDRPDLSPVGHSATEHPDQWAQEPFDPGQWDRDYALRAGHTPEEAEAYVRERADERSRAMDEGRAAAEHYVGLHQQGRQQEAIAFSRSFENDATGEAFSRFVDHLNYLEEQQPSFRHTIEHNPNEPRMNVEEINEFNKQLKEAQKGDTIKLIKDKAFTRTSNNHQFQYASKKGTGSLSITERMGGRDLWVNWIGLERHGSGEFVSSPYEEGPQNFGTKEIKSLLDQIKTEFPNAERIGGFRVSGARKFSGSGAANAWMRIRPKKSIDTYHDDFEENRAQEPGMQAVDRAMQEVAGGLTPEQIRQAARRHNALRLNPSQIVNPTGPVPE